MSRATELADKHKGRADDCGELARAVLADRERQAGEAVALSADTLNDLWRSAVDHADPTAGNAHIHFARKVIASLPAPQAVQADSRALALLRESRNTLFMWRDVAPAVSLLDDIDKFLDAAPSPDGKAGHYEEQPDGTVTPVDPADRGFTAEQAEAPSDWRDTIQGAIDELPYQHYLIPRLVQLLSTPPQASQDARPTFTTNDTDLDDLLNSAHWMREPGTGMDVGLMFSDALERVKNRLATQPTASPEQAEAPSDIEDAKEELAALFFQCARYERPSTDWRAALDAFCKRLATQPTASNAGEREGWKEAAIAWEVCASLHRQWAKGKDALFTTRQADFVKHAADARAALATKPPTGEQKPVEWGAPTTVEKLIRQLQTFDPATPITSAVHTDYKGKRTALTMPLTMSRERVAGRFIRQGDESVPYSLVIWAQPDELGSHPEPVAPPAREAQEFMSLLDWKPGANEFKDWCCQWFGPDSDDTHLGEAANALLAMAGRVKAGLKSVNEFDLRCLLAEERETNRQLVRAHREATEPPTFMGEPVLSATPPAQAVQDIPYRRCKFCGCNTNAALLSCCMRGQKDDAQRLRALRDERASGNGVEPS